MMYECDEAKFKGQMLVKAQQGEGHAPDSAIITFHGSLMNNHKCKYCSTFHYACCTSLDACEYDVPFALSLASLRLYPGAT
jgi:hypothetical protein